MITLKKDRVTVVLNGQTVIDNVELPASPPAARLGSSITATRWSSRICSSRNWSKSATPVAAFPTAPLTS